MWWVQAEAQIQHLKQSIASLETLGPNPPASPAV